MRRRALALALLWLPLLTACQPLTDEDGAGQATVASESAASGVVSGTVDAAAPAAAPPATASDSGAGAAGEMAHGATADTGSRAMAAEDVTTTVGAELAAASADPKPSDPLTAGEIAKANSLALGSPDTELVVANAVDRDAVNAESVTAVRSLSGEPSYRVLYTQRAPDKTGELRAAEVGIYRYDTDEQVLNNVDLATGKVTTQDLPEGFVLPLVPDEITEATTVARADPRVREALEAAGLDPERTQANALMTVGLEPGSPCATSRCLKLFFSTFEQPVPAFHVVVNLSDLSVVEVLPFEVTRTGQTGGEDQ